MVADRELLGEGVQGGEGAPREVAHHVRAARAGGLAVGREIVADEAAVLALELREDVRGLVLGIGLDLGPRAGLLRVLAPGRIAVRARVPRAYPFELRVDLGHAPEHLVEGAVFQHEEDDVLEGVHGPGRV